MSEPTLLAAITNLQAKYHLNHYQSSKCHDFFSYIKIGDLIYPGHFKSKILVDIKTAYSFMEELKNLGFVKNVYEVYCTECGKSKGVFIESLSDFKIDMACDFCSKDLSVFEDVIVLYKVIQI